MRPALTDYRHLASGKVRELYRVDDDHLLFVATDRISAFDHILQTPIPDKGRILTAMSVFFFGLLDTPNHLAGPADDARIPAEVLGRALVVRTLEMVPVECVARGYLTGSGLTDYQATGAVCGIELPAGLVEASKFDQPLFTPATKAELGAHDENITFDRVVDLVGARRADQLRELTLATYTQAAEHARRRGIIIADTKFEFGLDAQGQVVLMDEVLTPDSSRYWPADQYAVGSNPPSYDKQFLRDWLETAQVNGKPWDKTPPSPRLPREVIDKTAAKYQEALTRLMG